MTAEPFDPYYKWLGIRPEEQPPHHYRLLGLSPFESDPDVIDAAAEKQTAFLQRHTAGPHVALTQQLLNEISAARLCLLNPKKKAAYDAALRRALAGSAAVPPPPPARRRKIETWQIAVLALAVVLVVGTAAVLLPRRGPQPADPPVPDAVAALPPDTTTRDPSSSTPEWPPPGGDENGPRPEPPKPTASESAGAATGEVPIAPAPEKPPPAEPQPAEPQPAMDSQAANPAPPAPSSEAQPAPSAPSPAAADSRSPVPEEDAQAKGMKLLAEIYGEERDAAKTIEQKKALAAKLLAKGQESRDDPTARYLFWKLARDVAVEATDGLTAFEAIQRTAEWFQVDETEMKADVLVSLSKKARLGADHRALARQADELIESAVRNDRLDLAVRLGDLALSEARAASDGELAKQLQARMTGVRELANAYEEARQAIETLKRAPSDPEGSLAAGRYYGFCRGDWEKGLPLLARGSDAALRELAAKDLQGTSSAEEQVQLGDGWREWAEQEEGAAKKSLGERAALWYNRALPQLAGLTKDKVEKRLQELTAGAGPPGPAGAGPSKLAGAIVGHFQVGMLQRKTRQRTTVFWEFRPDRSLWEKDRQIAQWSATDSQVRVVFADKSLGEALLRPKKRDLFLGTHILANNDVWACELQKLFVLGVWEYHWGSDSNTRKLWSNGRQFTPDGTSTWERKGSQIIFRYPSGAVDTCTLAPDGKSFKGSNQVGTVIWGILIAEQ